MMMVVAMMMQRSGFEAGYLVSYSFRVADPGCKSRPLHLFSYASGFFVPSHKQDYYYLLLSLIFVCLLLGKTDFIISCFFCSYYNTRDLHAIYLLATIYVKPLV